MIRNVRCWRPLLLLPPDRWSKLRGELLLRLAATIFLLMVVLFQSYRAFMLYRLPNSPERLLISAVVLLSSGAVLMMWVVWRWDEL